MDNMPFSSLLFNSFPESIIIVILGLQLMGQELNALKIIIISIISAVSAFFVRSLPLPYGVHTIMGVLILTLLLFWIHRIECKVAFASALLAISCLITTQLTISSLFLKISGLTIKEILSNNILRILVPLPELLVLGVTAFILVKYNISFVKDKTINNSKHQYTSIGEETND